MFITELRNINAKYDYFYPLPGIAFSLNEEVKGVVIFWLIWVLWIPIRSK